MSFITWILLGFVIGIIANIVTPNSRSFLGTILISILGSFLGGFLAEFLFLTSGERISTIIALSIGSIILLLMQRALLSRKY